MTERGRLHLNRSARAFSVGPSRVDWNGQSIDVRIDERCSPLPRRVRGRVRLHPDALCTWTTALDVHGRHRWGPIAPCARIELDLAEPALRWRGTAYFDSNEGDEPIENGFRRWDWLRAAQAPDRCAVFYDVETRSGAARTIGASFGADGSVEPLAISQRQELPATRWWRVRRRVPMTAGHASVHRTLEDTPFYARSLLNLSLGSAPVEAVHETLDVTRLVSPVVQRLLPVRMPRIA
jgi:carotenoid 1,2-hydratase